LSRWHGSGGGDEFLAPRTSIPSTTDVDADREERHR
jgi:hypothetical protein